MTPRFWFKPASLGLLLLGLFAACRREESPKSDATGNTPSWFEESASRLGINFIHDGGPVESFFMPASIGSGGALFDFDSDGRLDVYLIHCVPPESNSRNQLFHQQPDGLFRNVSEGSGLDVSGYGMGATAGDLNNDGLVDLLLTEYGRARLFLNRGHGKFQDTSAAAGLDNPRWATGASFFDYDRDGWLDIVIANYVDYSPTHPCHDRRGALEFCGPQGLAGTVSRLFRNTGRGADGIPRFQDVTALSGLALRTGPALGVFCADFDGDRWPDIFIADDGQPNRLFMNRRDGTFAEEATMRGVALNALGGTAGNMGVAPGDFDGDGLFDLFVTHLNWEQHSLWKQGPRGVFQDVTAAAGLLNPARRGTGFGTVMSDFNLDGWSDLALVNGSIKRDDDPAPRVDGLPAFWSSYAQRNQVFANDGHGRFREVSAGNPAFGARANVGRGLLCGDLNNDGAEDLLIVSTACAAQVFLNVTPRRGHWLTVRAIDPTLGGRDAIGAEIIVEAGSRRWWRLVQPSYSYLASNDPRAHFGLGRVPTIDRLRIIWPDGSEETFPAQRADGLLTLRKGDGAKP